MQIRTIVVLCKTIFKNVILNETINWTPQLFNFLYFQLSCTEIYPNYLKLEVESICTAVIFPFSFSLFLSSYFRTNFSFSIVFRKRSILYSFHTKRKIKMIFGKRKFIAINVRLLFQSLSLNYFFLQISIFYFMLYLIYYSFLFVP